MRPQSGAIWVRLYMRFHDIENCSSVHFWPHLPWTSRSLPHMDVRIESHCRETDGHRSHYAINLLYASDDLHTEISCQ